MRLKTIKLAGFKSFVDPTALDFSVPLVAVIGPNGCGKSNIIDAIRWVMGESSAKNLRGESMSDVIFNGSSSRKPVGQAMVELIFDNSDGSLGGEYAQYAEISIRRVGSRDGDSSYFLNGTRCRRKDITEVFMGTGLGPRSYSIIEQGMISRVIEARPEDLRAFLEEAAGISLYRKRRQETEIRMRHTRENLARLDDVHQELEKQLERLKRQSEAALKYQEYKEERDRLERELDALRFKTFNVELQNRATNVRMLATALEEKQADRTHLETEVERLRLNYNEKNDAWKVIQGQYYTLGSEIARTEQTLQHYREQEEVLQKQIVQTEQDYQKAFRQLEQDKERLRKFDAELALLLPDLEETQLRLEETEYNREEAEEAMRHFSAHFERFQQDAEEPKRSSEVEKTKIEQLERQTREGSARLRHLKDEQTRFNLQETEKNLEEMEQEMSQLEFARATVEEKLSQLTDNLTSARTELAEGTKNLEEARSKLQMSKGRFASLEALQHAALGKTQTSVKEWLNTAELAHCPRLGENLTVVEGFERAVETVLGQALEAVCIPALESIDKILPNFKEGNLTLLEEAAHLSPVLVKSENAEASVLLASKVKTSLPIAGLLSGIYVVEDWSTANMLRKKLAPQESVVTKEGLWLGPNWLRIHKGHDAHTGVIEREAELKTLLNDIETFEEKVTALETKQADCRKNLEILETERSKFYSTQQEQASIVKGLASKTSAERTKLEHVRQRLTKLQEEIEEQAQKLSFAEEEIAISRLKLETSLNNMEDFQNRKQAILEERDTLRELLHLATKNARETKEKTHSLAMQYQTLLTQKKGIVEGLERVETQLQDTLARKTALQTTIESFVDPKQESKDKLDKLLAEQITLENTLQQAKAELDVEELALRTLEKQRVTLEEEANRIRSTLESARMDWQVLEVRCQTLKEKWAETDVNFETILAGLDNTAEESVWAEKLEQVTRRIERLGAINLAAIEEYQSELERQGYLELQLKDLNEALVTLENAIRKIDKETRSKFKETFDRVNDEFQVLFPRLFGGGQAYLELTGEDLLEAGVSVLARPPGKRNSSIHLLSGGEKALTAVALVFAIFQLNPAPFCLLDEVDAPLDDANVGRFCKLVQHMSETVQFIIVTHNKLAMEIAQHLVGVTMKEPGVSRLVSVDIEEAASLAGS
jgi:chromosome segregation protein